MSKTEIEKVAIEIKDFQEKIIEVKYYLGGLKFMIIRSKEEIEDTEIRLKELREKNITAQSYLEGLKFMANLSNSTN